MVTIRNSDTGSIKVPAEGSAWLPKGGVFPGEDGKRWDVHVTDDGMVEYKWGHRSTGRIHHTPLTSFWNWVALTDATEITPRQTRPDVPWAARVEAAQQRDAAETPSNVVPFRRRAVA